MSVDYMVTVETPRCFQCGCTGEIRVPSSGLTRRRAGALMQEAFPELDKGLREQLISGTHPECWAEMFGSDDE